jgi:hypothetical protein
MKLTKLAFAAAVAWSLYASGAIAQDIAQQPTAQQPTIQQPQAATASYSDYYYTQPSPSDQPAAAAPVQKMVQAPEAAHVCDEAAEEACEPWRLFCQKECGWNIYGFVAAGAATNDDASFFNGPTTFPDYSDAYMNQLYAIVENTIDTGGCGCDWGGRVDVLYGTDYIFTQAVGLETRETGAPKWNSDPFYGVAMPQAYLELGYNNLAVKLGHFYTPIGYEVVPATGNFFYTHAYTMQYGEPFTHTGGLATWKASDNLSIVGGFVNGWDNFDRVNDTGAAIAGFTWTNGDALTVALYGIASPNETKNPLAVNSPTLDTNRDMYSLVMTYLLTENLTYVFQHDNGYQRDGSVFADQSAEWYGINQYLLYTINDCWKAGMRFEWFRDDDGTRVGAVRPGNPLEFGHAGNFYAVSAGLNWSPHANFIIRPELRYDWFDGENLTGNDPFDTDNLPGDDEQLLAAMDIIFLW